MAASPLEHPRINNSMNYWHKNHYQINIEDKYVQKLRNSD